MERKSQNYWKCFYKNSIEQTLILRRKIFFIFIQFFFGVLATPFTYWPSSIQCFCWRHLSINGSSNRYLHIADESSQWTMKRVLRSLLVIYRINIGRWKIRDAAYNYYIVLNIKCILSNWIDEWKWSVFFSGFFFLKWKLLNGPSWWCLKHI